jgi:hypothetical protein
MNMKMTGAIAGLLLASATAAAQANPVDVSYTLSGSPGDWVYDFSISNNYAAGYDVYSLVVPYLGPILTQTGSPAGWVPEGGDQWCYTNCFFFGGLSFGQSVNGFEEIYTSATPLSSVLFQVALIDPETGANPVVYGDAAATPLPAALPLMGTGLGMMGLLGWRRKRKKTAAIAAA